MALKPYVVQSDTTVRGTFIRRGTVVELDPAGELAGEYGYDNLQPLAADQAGDDADHAETEN